MIWHPYFKSQSKFLKAGEFSCRRDENPRGSRTCIIVKSQCQISIHSFLIEKKRESGHTMNHSLYGKGETGKLLIEPTVSPATTHLNLPQSKMISPEDNCSTQHCTIYHRGQIYSKWTTGFWRQSWAHHSTPAWPHAEWHLYCNTSLRGNGLVNADYLYTQNIWYLSLQYPSQRKWQMQQRWSFLLTLVPEYNSRYKLVWSKGRTQATILRSSALAACLNLGFWVF